MLQKLEQNTQTLFEKKIARIIVLQTIWQLNLKISGTKFSVFYVLTIEQDIKWVIMKKMLWIKEKTDQIRVKIERQDKTSVKLFEIQE